MPMNDLHDCVASDTHALDSNTRDIDSHPETPILPPIQVVASDLSSVSRNTDVNRSMSSSLSSSSDFLPRPQSHVQHTILDLDIEGRTLYDSTAQDPVGSSNNASFHADHVLGETEGLRQESLGTVLSTSVNGEDVGTRLLQAMPQLGIGQLLHDFTSQISPWRGFTTGRNDVGQDDTEEVNETERFLRNQEAGEEVEEEEEDEEGREALLSTERPLNPRTSSILSMSSTQDFERSDNVSHLVDDNGNEDTANGPSTVRVDNSTRGRRNSDEESDDQTAMDEVQALFRRCHNFLPFLALFLIYFAYQHATGILVFVVGTVAVMGLDQRMRAQIALKDKANTWHLLGIVIMCAINMVAICSVAGEANPLHHFSQTFQPKTTNHGSDSESEQLSTGGIFWQVLWTVLVNDFLIRLWSVVVKAFVAGAKSDRFQCERKFRDEATTNADESPSIVILVEETDSTATAAPLTQQAVSTVAFYRRKRKLYGIIEMCSIFLRSLLASMPWCSFYQLCASKFMADVFTFAYLFIKGLILANQGRRIFILARSFVTLGLEFGVYVSHDDLVEAGSPDCSICYESMKQPVKLACSHMFCEECVTEWFDHERSCPLCRASVESSGPADAENVKPQFLDGRTSLVPQLL